MRTWMPQTLYDAKPWALIGVGTILGLGATGWPLAAGSSVVGDITLQLRQDYRARSKWRREMPP